MSLNFDEFQKVVETAQQADAVKADLKRALKRVTSALESLQTALADVETVVSDDYMPATRKPRKTRAANAEHGEDGTNGVHKKPGRPKKIVE
jgi:Skp family chaperone for outer membrane proteins